MTQNDYIARPPDNVNMGSKLRRDKDRNRPVRSIMRAWEGEVGLSRNNDWNLMWERARARERSG